MASLAELGRRQSPAPQARLADLGRQAELRAWNPSWRDRLSWLAGDASGLLGLGRYGQQDVADKLGGLMDFIPGVGDALAANDAWRDFGAGNYGGAALGAGLAAVGLVPGVGDALAAGGRRALKGAESFASRSPRMYDPPVKSPRSFEDDYRGGVAADGAGNLVRDIDGRPLSAAHVVGRRRVSGPDVPLPPEALDEIATARTGEAIRSVAPGSPDIGQDMGRAVFRSGGRPDYVAVANSLTGPQRGRVAAHEIGHVIDQLAAEIPVDGLNDELRTVYNDLNNPQSYGKRFGPEQNRYKGAEAKRELVAEALRAYMQDPNYLKSVAPKTAARIREYVNANPRLKDIIQFNSVAGAAGGLAISGALHDDDRSGDL